MSAKRSPRLALLALTVASPLIGCDDLDTADGETAVVLSEEVAVPARRIHDDGGFILASAATPPEVTVRRAGPFTLRYVGPHHYVIPQEDVTIGEPELLDDAELQPRLVDGDGHEWMVVERDVAEVRRLGNAYRAALTEIRELAAPDGHTSWGDLDDLSDGSSPQAAAPAWTEFHCGDAEKLRYNPGTQVDLDSVNNSQRRPIIDTWGVGWSGTAVLIADDLALTAGHVATALAEDDLMCQRAGTSGMNCAPVEATMFNATESGPDDWGLVKFKASFPGDWAFRLSDHTNNQINDHTPRLAGYPAIVLGEEASCGMSSALEGERNLGDLQARKKKHVRVDITAGHGSSGGPFYFYENGEYWIFGIITGPGQNWVGDRFMLGPKVPFWLDDIVAEADALGVNL